MLSFSLPLSSICYTARFLLVSFPFLPLPYSFSSLITRLLHYVLPLCVTMTPKSPFHIVYVYANDDYNPPALFRKDTGWSVSSFRLFTLLCKVCLPLCTTFCLLACSISRQSIRIPFQPWDSNTVTSLPCWANDWKPERVFRNPNSTFIGPLQARLNPLTVCPWSIALSDIDV